MRNLAESELLDLESGNGSWYCTGCKADCGLCSGAVLYGHKAVQCDKCEMGINNRCSLITYNLSLNLLKTQTAPGFVQNVTFNFSDLFFTYHLNLENQNRFDPLAKDSEIKTSQTGFDL